MKFERFLKKTKTEQNETDISRRNFVTGSAALAAVMLSTQAEAEVLRPQSREDALSERMGLDEREALVLSELPLTWRSFETTVSSFEAHYQQELPYMLEFGTKETIDDAQGRSRLEYLRTALVLPNFPPAAAAQIRHLLPAKAFVESGYNAEKVSSSGAAGILQFMPDTWIEHGDPGKDILSLIAQVEATDSLLEQIRATFELNCQQELDYIRDIFFDGDEESFITDFYILLLGNAFNAGATTMVEVVKKFCDRIVFTNRIQEILAMDIPDMQLNTKDAFQLMTHLAENVGYVDMYKEEASAYVKRIFAARAVLDTSLSPEQRVTLLGQEDLDFVTRG